MFNRCAWYFDETGHYKNYNNHKQPIKALNSTAVN